MSGLKRVAAMVELKEVTVTAVCSHCNTESTMQADTPAQGAHALESAGWLLGGRGSLCPKCVEEMLRHAGEQ